MITRTTVSVAIKDVLPKTKDEDIEKIVSSIFDKTLAAEPSLPKRQLKKYAVEAHSIPSKPAASRKKLNVAPALVMH